MFNSYSDVSFETYSLLGAQIAIERHVLEMRLVGGLGLFLAAHLFNLVAVRLAHLDPGRRTAKHP